MGKNLLLVMVLCFIVLSNSVFALGPFSLPIHDNTVEINGGAWYYSSACVASDPHAGFDFEGENGDDSDDSDIEGDGGITEVYAAAYGVVESIDNSCFDETTEWGCTVKIKHDTDGDGIYDYRSMYAHLYNGSIKISEGADVTTNTLIALVGNSGASDGAHLHFGIQDFTTTCTALSSSCWLDPYDLYDATTNPKPTCCDIPNGCPAEKSEAGDTSTFDCTNWESNDDYLWASCYPTYDETSSIDEIECTFMSDYFCADRETTADTPDNGTWENTSLEMNLFIDGTKGIFTITKDDASAFSSNGIMYLKVGSYELYGTDHDEVAVSSEDFKTSLELEDDFGCNNASTYPKSYYARFESDLDSGYEVVGPIMVDALFESDLSLSAPENIIVEATDDHIIEISWDLVNDATEYRICRSADENMGYSQIYWSSDGSYTDLGLHLEGGTTYYYKIAAGNVDGWSDFSEIVSDTTHIDIDDGTTGLAKDDSNSTEDGTTDSGSDVLSDLELYYLDSDEDGLFDGDELGVYGTDPLDTDSDNDGLNDGEEISEYGTKANDPDSDDDGIYDSLDEYPLMALGEIEVVFNDEDSLTNGYGLAIAVDGDVVVIGAEMDYPDNPYETAARGIVYVYRWDDSQWNLEANLTPVDESYSEAAFDYGKKIALDGDVLVVSAAGHHDYGHSIEAVGAVYVYRYNETTAIWDIEAKLTPTTTYYGWNENTLGWTKEIYSGVAMGGQEKEYFGFTLDADDGVIVAGAPGYNTQVGCVGKAAAALGAVYVFRYDEASSWDVEKQITGTDSDLNCVAELDFVDAEIALDGNVLLIGDRNDETKGFSAGAVYVYEYGTSWVQTENLTAEDAGSSDYFGSAVALDGDTAVIGAYGDGYDTGTQEGAAYVFQKNNGVWEQQAKLTAADMLAYEAFGSDVALSDELIVIGTRNEYSSIYGSDIGKAYTFRWDGESWKEEEIIKPDGTTNTWRFGNLVAASDALVLIGWQDQEKVYVYYRPDLDTDNDGLTDEEELDYGTDFTLFDTDSDGLDDYDEIFLYGSDPADIDTDADGLSDGDEVSQGTDLLVALDTDGDGVTDILDACILTVKVADNDDVNSYGCALSEIDSDSDGLFDYDEINIYSTDPNDADSDADGIQDSNDSDPLFADADEDGVSDISDLCSDTSDMLTVDVNGCSDSQRDSDTDGLSDYDEMYTYSTDPNDFDSDNDVLSDWDEIFLYNTDPNERDSDQDRFTDRVEIQEYGTNPLRKDTDGDQLTDYQEIITYMTDPLDKDTDDDGYFDGDEVTHGTDPTIADIDCSDSDNGKDYSTQGTISGGIWYITGASYKDKTDSCLSSDKIREYFCTEGYGFYTTRYCSVLYGASSSCVDGACVLGS